MGSFVLCFKGKSRHLAEGGGRRILVRDGWVKNRSPKQVVSNLFKNNNPESDSPSRIEDRRILLSEENSMKRKWFSSQSVSGILA